jgi:hypothetical protein
LAGVYLIKLQQGQQVIWQRIAKILKQEIIFRKEKPAAEAYSVGAENLPAPGFIKRA